jgi:glycosyltransferase involved in cell wall biosynthesis
MDIVLIGPAYPYRGGLASYNERLARALLEAGHRVSLYTFTVQYPRLLFPGKTQYSSSPAPEGLQIKRKINATMPLSWFRVGAELRRAKPDLLVFHYWLPFLGPAFAKVAAVAKRNKHTKSISILHNIVPHEKRIGDRMFTKWFVKRMDGFVAQSQTVLEDLNRFDSDKPRLLSPHPLFDNFGEPIPKSEAKHLLGLDPAFSYVLFFGFIRAYKGLDLLLHAWADQRIAGMPLRLIIAGEYYENADRYKALIAKLGLEDRIVQRNEFIPNEQVNRYFCASDLLVQPYRQATQSGVAQIAYHFNRPMIVTNVGGLPEIVPHNRVGYVVKPDALDIANHIVRFFAEGKEAEFSANAAQEKNRFSWQALVQAIEKVNESI